MFPTYVLETAWKCNRNIRNDQNCFWGRFFKSPKTVRPVSVLKRLVSKESTEDDPRSETPLTFRNDDVMAKTSEKLRNDRRLTVRELTAISVGSYRCTRILLSSPGINILSYFHLLFLKTGGSNSLAI